MQRSQRSDGLTFKKMYDNAVQLAYEMDTDIGAKCGYLGGTAPTGLELVVPGKPGSKKSKGHILSIYLNLRLQHD